MGTGEQVLDTQGHAPHCSIFRVMKYDLTIQVLTEYRERLQRGGDLRRVMTAEDAKELWTDINDAIGVLEKEQGILIEREKAEDIEDTKRWLTMG